MSGKPTYEEIERRAYELWEKRGRPQGYDSEFWAEAERELKFEVNGAGTSDPPSEPVSPGPHEPFDRIRR